MRWKKNAQGLNETGRSAVFAWMQSARRRYHTPLMCPIDNSPLCEAVPAPFSRLAPTPGVTVSWRTALELFSLLFPPISSINPLVL
jgi:hypothetical protein